MRNEWIKIAVSALVLSTCATANAQQIEFAVSEPIVTSSTIQNVTWKEVLSSRVVPLSIKGREMNATWHSFTTTEGFDLMSLMLDDFDLPLSSLPFYSQGNVLSIAGETYLVTYSQKVSERKARDKAIDANSPLQLSLLNVRSIDSFNQIQPFDPQVFVVAPLTQDEDLRQKSVSNLKQLMTGTIMWAQDMDEKFPPMRSYAEWKNAILPFVQDEGLFVQPVIEKQYILNPILSGKKQQHILQQGQFAAVYEAQTGSDGKRAVAFADGSVKRITEAEWVKIKKVSKIK